jgi:hypothetical protein
MLDIKTHNEVLRNVNVMRFKRINDCRCITDSSRRSVMPGPNWSARGDTDSRCGDVLALQIFGERHFPPPTPRFRKFSYAMTAESRRDRSRRGQNVALLCVRHQCCGGQAFDGSRLKWFLHGKIRGHSYAVLEGLISRETRTTTQDRHRANQLKEKENTPGQ